MGITSVGSDPTTSAAAATTTTDPNAQPMDRQAFLKLLVAQLSHQDPLNPMQGTEFVSQLSQFAIVEQAIAQSAKLDLLSTQLRGMSNSDVTNLVGKTVTVQGKGMAFDGVTATSASVTLSGPATKTTVQIKDEQGRVVRTMELGARPAGALAITWDGKDDNGQAVAKGTYQVSVNATDANGNAVTTSQSVTGTVKQVSFDKGYPELLLDSGVSAPVSDLVSVGSAKP